MRCDSWASLLAFTLANPCFGREPKARVAILWDFKSEINSFHLSDFTIIIIISL
jgi:hypothetical protein